MLCLETAALMGVTTVRNGCRNATFVFARTTIAVVKSLAIIYRRQEEEITTSECPRRDVLSKKKT